MTALPAALSVGQDGSGTDRAATATRLLGIVVLAAGAVVPRRVVVRRLLVSPLANAAALAAVGALLAVGAPLAIGALLPLAASTGSPAAGSLRTGDVPLLSDPVFLRAQVLGGLLLTMAATSLTAKTVRYGDDLLRWLAAACAVAVVARFHYLLYPSLYSEYVYSRDLLRLGSHVLMLVGAAREIRSYWAPADLTVAIGSARRASRTSSRSPA